jgi:hypothetical protein
VVADGGAWQSRRAASRLAGAAVVEWKPGTVVYLSKSNNAAVDSLLLVGDAEDGSKSKEPHVFLFQF